MRIVIGEYTSQVAAERAVHALERLLSIQTCVIGAGKGSTGQHKGSPLFLVKMGGTRELIERARVFLQELAAGP